MKLTPGEFNKAIRIAEDVYVDVRYSSNESIWIKIPKQSAYDIMKHARKHNDTISCQWGDHVASKNTLYVSHYGY